MRSDTINCMGTQLITAHLKQINVGLEKVVWKMTQILADGSLKTLPLKTPVVAARFVSHLCVLLGHEVELS